MSATSSKPTTGITSGENHLGAVRAEMQENPGLVTGNDPTPVTATTLEQIRAMLIELPDSTVEEFAELLHRIHSCADQLLSVLEQEIPEVEGKPQVAALARLLAGQILMRKLEGMVDDE